MSIAFWLWENSFTEGQGAPSESTWLSVLGQQFNSATNSTHIQVINGGVGGSDPFYEYQLFSDKLIQYEPDLVLLVINVSDVWDTIVRGGFERFKPDNQIQFSEPPPLNSIYGWSHLVRFVVHDFFEFTHLAISRSEIERRGEDAVQKIKQAISRFEETTDSIGAKFLVVLHPGYSELVQNHYLFDLPTLLEFSNESGIPSLDIMPYLHFRIDNGKEEPELLYWRKDGHFSPSGYRLFANSVKERLCAPEDLLVREAFCE